MLSPIEGGPAARAGIQPGDRVLSIDGHDTTGMDRENAAARLRGSSGSSVVLRVASRADAVDAPTPGVAAAAPTRVRAVRLTREKVELSPVSSTLITSPTGGRIGYVRLAGFTARAADDVRSAVARLAADGAGAYILDLRDNPGGLVRAGLDVASVWLGGGSPVFSVAGRANDGAPASAVLQRVVLPDDGDAAPVSSPLAVLVDHGSASAAEIVAGALHDNSRATIVGARTFGKGKIQTVYPLHDGSALFVTVARYVTPRDHVIDGRGVAPDVACRSGGSPPSALSPRLAAGVPGMAALLEASLDADPCVLRAEAVLSTKKA